MAETIANTPEFTVTELSMALKRTVEDSFGYVRVRGEIGSYRGPHSSGHAYFCLKDESAQIDAVVWRSTFQRLRFKPEEGLEVVATGRLTTFPRKSTYQLSVEALEPAGIGALMALLDERRRRLAQEGLFDAARKRPLPFLPRIVGVVTSPTGAVIRDILHRLSDRFPVDVLVWPVRVQGETCAAEVAAAIAGFNALPPGGEVPRPDVIVVARGGGSLEDLWGFNDETVVRAAAASAIPLISAVGHETDTTLIDLAADRRAPTPSAAAEMAVPVRAELVAKVSGVGARLSGAALRGLGRRRTELRAVAGAIPSAQSLLLIARQRLDLGAARLAPALAAEIGVKRADLLRAGAGLAPGLVARPILVGRERLAALVDRARTALRGDVGRRTVALARLGAKLSLSRLAERRARAAERLQAASRDLRRHLDAGLARRRDRLDAAGALLVALSYRGVLARGFALVRDAADRPVRRAADLEPGEPLTLQFADGQAPARVAGGEEAAIPKARRRRSPRAADAPEQESLF